MVLAWGGAGPVYSAGLGWCWFGVVLAWGGAGLGWCWSGVLQLRCGTGTIDPK